MELIIKASLFIIFIHTIFNFPGMILQPVGSYLEGILPEWFCKPLIGCPACMSPWWGTNIYIFASDCFSIIDWLLFIGAVGGLSFLISFIIYALDIYTKKNEDE